ncbi:GNAT family N-acetyltransferase [Desulfocurvibacter africanus]|uniref:GNAT family N-acetyltransferase n=1 Tax=Desulfocurvibacter africanus TaxID=873 RepID=UPI002FD8D9BB
MDVCLATMQDYDDWLILAREVEHLFGPMADETSFQEALRQLLAMKQAFCVRDGDNGSGCTLLGGIAIDVGENAIAWLAVATQAQGRGIGKALLTRAIEALDPDRNVVVQTFAPEVLQGIPARKLYQRFGFMDHALADPTPAGVPTVVMVRPAIQRKE